MKVYQRVRGKRQINPFTENDQFSFYKLLDPVNFLMSVKSMPI